MPRRYFDAGGERFRYVPCLNDRDDHLDFLADLAVRHLAGWLDEPRDEDERDLAGAGRRRLERARAFGLPAAGAASPHPTSPHPKG
jgi:hypothetical protein